MYRASKSALLFITSLIESEWTITVIVIVAFCFLVAFFFVLYFNFVEKNPNKTHTVCGTLGVACTTSEHTERKKLLTFCQRKRAKTNTINQYQFYQEFCISHKQCIEFWQTYWKYIPHLFSTTTSLTKTSEFAPDFTKNYWRHIRQIEKETYSNDCSLRLRRGHWTTGRAFCKWETPMQALECERESVSISVWGCASDFAVKTKRRTKRLPKNTLAAATTSKGTFLFFLWGGSLAASAFNSFVQWRGKLSEWCRKMKSKYTKSTWCT